MAYHKDSKEQLRRAYVFDNLSLEKAAKLLGVSYPTAQRWKNKAKQDGDDWDKVKSAHTLAGGSIEALARQLLTDFVVQFKATMDLVKDDDALDAKTRVELLTSLSDSYNKAIGANKKLMPEVSKLAIAMQVVNELGDYIKEHKPEVLPLFIEVLEPFGERLVRSFS